MLAYVFLCENVVKTHLSRLTTQTDRYLKYLLKKVPVFFYPDYNGSRGKKLGHNFCDFCLKWLDMALLCSNSH